MKRIIFNLLLLLVPASIFAQGQNTNETIREINKIKLDSNYIWAEGTSTKSKKEALENANTVLSFEIQNWLKSLGQNDVAGVVMPTSDQYMNIQTQRRNLHRAFVYVEKDKIMPYSKGEKVVVMERPKEKKKKEKAEEPASTSTYEEIYEPTAVEKEMLQVKTPDDIIAFVERDDIAKTGGYRELPSKIDYYIFIYNREGQVPACLKSVNDVLTNVATGKVDSYDNYKGCGGQWFIFKK